MKFQYAYRDKQNERHDGLVVASSKDDAFKKLRAQGVKPFFVAPAPGFFNRLQGIGKRGVAIGLLGVLCAGLGAALVLTPRTPPSNPQSEFDASISAQMRRQPIGDIAIIEKGVRTGWADAFPEEGERFLASFAVPGVPAGQRNTSEAEITAALARKVSVADADSIEVRQIKAMVEGMKNELRKFLADGGSIREYGRRLVIRQEEEIGYYQKAQRFIEQMSNAKKPEAEISAALDKYNVHLRSMGIKPVTMPEKGEKK